MLSDKQSSQPDTALDSTTHTSIRQLRYKFTLRTRQDSIELTHRDEVNEPDNQTNALANKIGGRRARNPVMEAEILQLARGYMRTEKALPPRLFVRAIARRFVDGNFKASKGWCDKFMKRNKAAFEEYLRDVNKQSKAKRVSAKSVAKVNSPK
mgnify:CR=1 FL=1